MTLHRMVSSVYPVFMVLTFKENNLNFVFIPNSKTNIKIKNKRLLIDSLCKTISHFRVKQFNNSSILIYSQFRGLVLGNLFICFFLGS